MVTKKINSPASQAPPAKRRTRRGSASESIILRLARIGESVPNEDWDNLPRDSAKNFDHYAHGSPREQ